MDRLPRDIAAERLHHDIVRLLDDHVARPSIVQQSMSQQQQQQQQHQSNPSSSASPPHESFSVGAPPKPKKRTSKAGAVRKSRKTSEDESGSLSQPNLCDGAAYGKPPPPYEDSFKAVSFHNLHYSYSQQTTQNYSPISTTSPNKQRPSLPTSPTHMAALRAATVAQQQQQQMLYYNGSSQYPTPPSAHSEGNTPPTHVLDSYPTPSPESPGQWSSSSPHSTSDWSEGISSPPTQLMYPPRPQVQMNFQQQTSRPEGIYI